MNQTQSQGAFGLQRRKMIEKNTSFYGKENESVIWWDILLLFCFSHGIQIFGDG